jgi:polyhydroxybutyrate depolymerase
MRVTFLLFGLFSALCVIGGCDSGSSSGDPNTASPPQPGLYKDNAIFVDGVQRTFDYYIPSDLVSEAVPLVILLHGALGNADSMTGEDGSVAPFKVWMDIAESEKLILIFPEGLVRPNGETGWNDCRGDATNLSTTDDVAFIAELIQQFRSTFAIDPDRIYASGISNGGFMSLRLALELSDQIAAVGVISAGMPAVSKCADADRPISVLFMNGTADPLVPYAGGSIGNPADSRGSVQSTSDSVQYWTDFNQTLQLAPASDFPDIDTEDDSTVRRYRYFDGLQQTEVVLYEITGGGHGGPSIQQQYSALAELIIGQQNHDIEMANEVWAFFRDKRLE